MHQARKFASCTVFEGRVFVSGGFNNIQLNNVEAYDHIDDSWSNMPNMIERRHHHRSVAIKNKLFIIGGHKVSSVEVFHSVCNKFVLLKFPPQDLSFTNVVMMSFQSEIKLLYLATKKDLFFFMTLKLVYFQKVLVQKLYIFNSFLVLKYQSCSTLKKIIIKKP